MSCDSFGPLRLVFDAPSVTVVSGYAGFGSSFAQVPLWMWAGCEPLPPVSASFTSSESPCWVSVAVPLSPEPFCGLILKVWDVPIIDFIDDFIDDPMAPILSPALWAKAKPAVLRAAARARLVARTRFMRKL